MELTEGIESLQVRVKRLEDWKESTEDKMAMAYQILDQKLAALRTRTQ